MWLRIGKKREPKGSVEMFDRERRRRLFCGSWAPPPGVLDHHLYGAPVPDFPFMVDTNGDGRLAPAKPSTWMYPTQFPSKAYHVGKRLAAPPPSRLPLLKSKEDGGASKGKGKAPAADNIVVTDMEVLDESDYGGEDGMDLDDSDEEAAAPPSNVVILDGVDESVSAAIFRGLAADALFQARAAPVSILRAQGRMWLRFADTTNGRRAQGALGSLAPGVRATYTSEREFENVAQYTHDIWTEELEEDGPMPATVSSFGIEEDDPMTATVSSFERPSAADDRVSNHPSPPAPEVTMDEEHESLKSTSASQEDSAPEIATSPSPAIPPVPPTREQRSPTPTPAAIRLSPPLSPPATARPSSPATLSTATPLPPPASAPLAARSAPPIRSNASLEERSVITLTPRDPPTAPRAMLRPLEQRLSFAPWRSEEQSPQREVRPLPRRNAVPLYNRLSSAIPLGERLGPRSNGLLDRLSAPSTEHHRTEERESPGVSKRKREVETPVPPIASSSRNTLESVEDGEVREERAYKKVRRGKRSGRLVKEYEQRKAERAHKAGGVIDERDEESETRAHLESVLQTVAEVAEVEDSLPIEWDGEVAPSWAPEDEDDEAGPAKM
ncbi:hypothetical protein B0H16DRAFT_1726582 [Mycena metata]|uniref:Uncharacterized protein n=2 Tax=Mycena metata TaxID=1033252 RepID=A0AAD7N6H2_9AGAR|nr:hypothetical protein B0H16DRAFT_1726582 [Mycena metata]